MPNPFGMIFESFEGPTGPVVESVHQAAYERLLDLIESEVGHFITLRAPRAGYGKTMLLGRLNEKIKDRVTMVPVHLAGGQRIEGQRILEEFLSRLIRNVPGSGSLTWLDLCTRRLFAQGLLPLVGSGEVPCQDQNGAIDSLRERPVEAFDFHREEATIAQWSKEHFDVLSPRLASVLGLASGVSTRDTLYWIDLLFRYAARPPQEVSRIEDLINAVFANESRFRTDAGFLEGLAAFLNLLTLVEPVVLVLDEVDGLAGDADAALRVTSKLVFLWEACRRVNVLLSVNDDVWDSAFLPQLPAGFRDRLEDIVVRLHSLTPKEASELISARAGVESIRIINQLDLSSKDLYPRGILRAARDIWNHRDADHAATADAASADDLRNQSPDGSLKASGQLGDLISGFALPESQPLFSAGGPPARSGFSDPAQDDQPPASGPDFSQPMAPGSSKTFFPESPFSLSEVAGKVPQPPPESRHQESSLRPPPPPLPLADPPAKVEAGGAILRESEGEGDPANPASNRSAVTGASKEREEPFSKVPAFGSHQENPFEGADAVQPSPFEIVKPVQPSRSRQGAAPQGEVDAIDELLRQFREHRDS